MISAWQVYLVMQLDSINAVFGVIAILFGVAFLAVGIFGAMYVSIEIYGEEEKASAFAIYRRYMTRGGFAAIALATLSALIPSTKTAAAMIVVPAITSDKVIDTVAPEMRELYELTKDALRNLSKKPEPAKSEK